MSGTKGRAVICCRNAGSHCPGMLALQMGSNPEAQEVACDQITVAFNEQLLAVRATRVLPVADHAWQVPGIHVRKPALLPISAARISVSAQVFSGSVIL